MLDTDAFCHHLFNLKYNFFAGVPCSYLKPLINSVSNNCAYIASANEGDAIAQCAGAYLGGKKSVFLCQNSGLSNATSPLYSLNYPFKIPALGFIGYRGEPSTDDEPQHQLAGATTPALLDLLNIKWSILSHDIEEATEQLKVADNTITNRQSFFFLVRKNIFSVTEPAKPNYGSFTEPSMIIHDKTDSLPSRHQLLSSLAKTIDDKTAIITTTGYTSRELLQIKAMDNQFPMVGSMGCAPSIGLGLAISNPSKKVIVIDGDGALLMRTGVMSTIGYYQPNNLLHIILDNRQYESTGGQATTSSKVDFTLLAKAMSYSSITHAHSLDTFTDSIQKWLAQPRLSCLYIPITPNTLEGLARPNTPPESFTQQFMSFMAS